ncbi:zinc finger MYND domain-containing protein 12 isoform X1 [Pantherophis guttatus]|uniref:Zinc finger MYND domain-containing protein 12 isoform X1 n=1 Tax=Pantherophis guttatus TaxID=94885 RepID=A0A6P9C9S2_PANGU|nr:zinc finger MYND domain-containing protein 12 isoform X1 [Pantherophis guttatus]
MTAAAYCACAPRPSQPERCSGNHNRTWRITWLFLEHDGGRRKPRLPLSNGALATAAGEDGHADGVAGAPGSAPAEEAALRALPRPRQRPLRRLLGHLLLIFLAEVTYETAQNFLIEGHYEDAIPAALQSLKFSISIYGSSAVELVPPYLILAETSLGLGHLSQGEEYLSQAQWIVLKNTHCSYHVQSKLYRNLGLLHAAKGNLDESLYHLANDVYFACCAFGTTRNVAVSGGYFHMANVFSHQNKMDIVDSLYCEVVDLWYDHFSHFVEIQYQKLITPTEIDLLSVEDKTEVDVLDDKEQAEASQMLNSILDFRNASLRPQLEKEAKVLHALAMFHFLVHDLAKADEFVMRFLQTAQSLPKREPNELLYRLVKLIKSKEEQAK